MNRHFKSITTGRGMNVIVACVFYLFSVTEEHMTSEHKGRGVHGRWAIPDEGMDTRDPTLNWTEWMTGLSTAIWWIAVCFDKIEYVQIVLLGCNIKNTLYMTWLLPVASQGRWLRIKPASVGVQSEMFSYCLSASH